MRCAGSYIDSQNALPAQETSEKSRFSPQHLLLHNGCRLSTEIERQRGANAKLTEALAAAKAKSSELKHQGEAERKTAEADASAAVAREEVLRAEMEQARTRADAMGQSLAEVGPGSQTESPCLGDRLPRLARGFLFIL